MASSLTVVWDYDYSLIATNSDTFVPLEFSPSHGDFIRAEHREGVPWTPLMAAVAVRLHESGVSAEAIRGAAARVPVDAEHVRVIRELDAAGATQFIMSDANAFYINAFLDATDGLARIFAGRVVTNPALVDAGGCLRIAPYAAIPHGCPRCPPNLCKGAVLAALALRASPAAVVAYVGDGGGDECPARGLLAHDVVLARDGFPLAAALLAAPPAARVVPWASGAALRPALLSELGGGRA